MNEMLDDDGESERNFVPSETNAKRDLNALAHEVARIYRKAHLNSEEARYVHKRARHFLGLSGKPSGSRRLPEVLTPDELKCILAGAYCERPRYGLIVRTLFETGIRVGELVSIQVSDISFTERTIRVHGKGDKDRLVLFTGDLGQQLRLHLNDRTRGFLFESTRLASFSTRRIQQIIRMVAKRAGVSKRIHPHTYRHSMATFLRNQGVPLDVVQLLLGHNDPRTTQIYARLSLAPIRDEYDRAMNMMLPAQRSSL
jgi:integrase/recombinase XerD